MIKALLIYAALTAVPFCPVSAAGDGGTANALLVLPSDRTVYDLGFRAFLEKSGVKLTESYPPRVFVGYIPAGLDKELGSKYGARVYRERVDDWSSFAAYGEKAVYAVNSWNKRLLEDPPAAPLVVSLKVKKVSGGTPLLAWNEVMKAAGYRLQISRDEAFSLVLADKPLQANSYKVPPGLLPEGVYYWRVSGVVTLNNGDRREGAFSRPSSFVMPASGPRRDTGAGSEASKITAPVPSGGREP